MKKKRDVAVSVVVPIIVALIGVAGTVIGVLITRHTPSPGTEPPVLYVYKDNRSAENRYTDIAYIGSIHNGDDGSLYIDPGHRDNPQSGSTCIKISYDPADDSHWAGMMWLSGKDNFPPGPPVDGVDVGKVSKLTFWAKGDGAAKFFVENDTGAQVTLYVELTSGWKEYLLELPKSWERVCVGFGWSSNYTDAGEDSMVFYVDEIAYYK